MRAIGNTAGAPSFSDLSDRRDNNADFLRLFLAVVVLQYHSAACSGELFYGFWKRMAVLDFGGGWMAVNCFFAISGFLVTGSWSRSSGAYDFLRKRLLRIYPGYVVAMVICVAVVGPLAGAKVPGYFEAIRRVRMHI